MSAFTSAPDVANLATVLRHEQRQSLLSLILYLLETQRTTLSTLTAPHRPLQTTVLNSHDLYAESLTRTLSTLLSIRSPPVPTSPPTLYLSPSTTPAVVQALLITLTIPTYDARTRSLLLLLLPHLHLPTSYLATLESQLPPPSAPSTPASAPLPAVSNKWKIALSATAGALVIGATGGLATPLVAGAFGTLGLGSLATTATVSAGFGYYGARQTSEIARRATAGLSEFTIIPLQAVGARTWIGAAGWVREQRGVEEELVGVWRCLPGASVAVRWEGEVLSQLGTAMGGMVRDTAVALVGKELVARTVLAGVAAAVVLPLALVKAAGVVDHPFRLAMTRGVLAGRALAKVLREEEGGRPVVLVGVGMGAMVAFECARTLGREGVLGRVESLVLIGAAVGRGGREWREVRAAVSGRVVNVYSQNDWVLGFLGRAGGVTAGMRPITLPGVENVDFSAKVEGHLKYAELLPEILETVFPGENFGATQAMLVDNSREPQKEAKKTEEDFLLDFEEATGEAPVRAQQAEPVKAQHTENFADLFGIQTATEKMVISEKPKQNTGQSSTEAPTQDPFAALGARKSPAKTASTDPFAGLSFQQTQKSTSLASKTQTPETPSQKPTVNRTESWNDDDDFFPTQSNSTAVPPLPPRPEVDEFAPLQMVDNSGQSYGGRNSNEHDADEFKPLQLVDNAGSIDSWSADQHKPLQVVDSSSSSPFMVEVTAAKTGSGGRGMTGMMEDSQPKEESTMERIDRELEERRQRKAMGGGQQL